jgi:hypothetical protein
MMVMRIAITPSLNASTRPLVMAGGMVARENSRQSSVVSRTMERDVLAVLA